MGEKFSNDIYSESTHQIQSQNIMHTPREGLFQSSKNYEISNFCHFFLVFVNMGPYGRKIFKRHLL